MLSSMIYLLPNVAMENQPVSRLTNQLHTIYILYIYILQLFHIVYVSFPQDPEGIPGKNLRCSPWSTSRVRRVAPAKGHFDEAADDEFPRKNPRPQGAQGAGT